jgi:hypothetical protein
MQRWVMMMMMSKKLLFKSSRSKIQSCALEVCLALFLCTNRPDNDLDIVADYAPEVSPATDDQNNAKKRPSKERVVAKKTNSREDAKSLSLDKLARYSDAIIQIASRFELLKPSIDFDDKGEVVTQSKSTRASRVASRLASGASGDVATAFRGQTLRDQISIVHQARKLSMMLFNAVEDEDEEDEYDINLQDHLTADCPGQKACIMLKLTLSDEVVQEEAPDVIEPARLPRFYESEI